MKISTLFDEEVVKRDLKPIEFVAYIDNDFTQPLGEVVDEKDNCRPDSFEHLKLIAKGIYYDVIAGWYEGADIDSVCVFLGHWNDGVVS